LKDKGNWKYFLCYKQAFRINKKEKLNWIKYISLALIFIVIIFQILYCISVKILFPFNKNKSKREKATNKNLKNSNISLDKTYTISYKRENDKSDEQTIDLDKTFTIPYKSENDIPDDQITDTNKTFIMSEKSENYISDEQILDDNKEIIISDKSENDMSDDQSKCFNINKAFYSNNKNINDMSDSKDNDSEYTKKKNCLFNNFISNQDTIGNSNNKENFSDISEDTKNKNCKNSNNIYKSQDTIDNLDEKNNNNEEKKNNIKILIHQDFDDINFGKSNKSKKTKIYKSDSFKAKNKNIKEKFEINKLDGMDDDAIKTNNKDLKEKYFKIKYYFTFINLEVDFLSLFNEIIIFILSIHNLFFYSALLFYDKTISRRFYIKQKNEIIYLLSKEYNHILLVFFICKIIDRIFKSSLKRSKEILYLANKTENEINYKNEKEIFIINQKEITNRNAIQIRIKSSNENENEKKIDLIKTYKLRNIIIHILIILIQLIYFYYFMIFGNVNPNIQFPLLCSSITFIVIDITFKLFYNAIKDRIKECIIKENNCFLKCIYKLKKEIFK